MIPKPPGRDSACRAGNGFQISKTRKSIKPRSKYFQLTAFIMLMPSGWFAHSRGVAPGTLEDGARQYQNPPNRSVSCWPDTSSITTLCGSLMFQYLAVRCAVQT